MLTHDDVTRHDAEHDDDPAPDPEAVAPGPGGAPLTFAPPGAEVVPVGADRYNQILAHYYLEAELLDDGRLEEWTALLHPDLRYDMPVRATKLRRDGSGFHPGMSHFRDTHASILLRVRRLTDTKTAWAEDPPSRTRHFVTNVRVRAVGPACHVRSNLLVTRSRWDDPDYDLISAERQDILEPAAEGEGGLLLRQRQILVDQTTLGTMNLAIFL